MSAFTPLPRPLGLPDFPWDTLNDARNTARAHWSGILDLSVGTPVDPTPERVQRALADSANAPGYPLVVGTQAVKDSIHAWMARRKMVRLGDDGVIPTTGSKEIVAWLPTLLGVGPGDKVLFPEVAYPTYEVGAVLAGAEPVPVDQRKPQTWPDATLAWINTPSNPTGEVLSRERLREIMAWARDCGAVVISDECYAELPWTRELEYHGVPSLLETSVCGNDASGLLVSYSLSKQSNMAGYRAGLLAGDPNLVSAVVEARKHAGMIVPTPVQGAMAEALVDTADVAEQRDRYLRRMEVLSAALTEAGLLLDPLTEAGLYLWVQAPEDWVLPPAPNRGRALVDWFAQRGILVAPGDFYGTKSADHVRVSLTASDEAVAQVAGRLRS